MLISNSRRFVFVHIHKCAGTSIEMALDEQLKWNDLLLGSTETGRSIQDGYMRRFGLSKHSSAADIQRVIGHETWRDYFTFAFVRHPCDRLVSLYEFSRTMRDDWARTLPSNNLLKRLLLKKGRTGSSLTLDEVPDSEPWSWPVMKALLTTDGFSEFIRSDYLDAELGARPQVMSTDDPATGERMVEFIGKVESIDRDWVRVCDRLGIPHVGLGMHNRSATRSMVDWREFYSPRDIDFIREKYDSDFESFDYEV